MASALVAKVRAKYGNAYSDMSDDELEAAVLAKHPEYADLASPKSRMTADVQAGTARAQAGAKARSEAPAENTIAGMQAARGGPTALDPETGRPDMTVPPAMASGVNAATNRGANVAIAAAPMLAAAPSTLAGAARLAGGVGAGEAVDYGARKVGLPPWAGMTLGALAGMGVGGGGVGKLIRGRFGGAPLGYTAEEAMAYLRPGARAAAEAAPAAARTAAVESVPMAAQAAPQAIGRAIAPTVESAAAQAASAAPGAAQAAEGMLPTSLSQDQLKILYQLRGMAQNNPASKIEIVQQAQRLWPENWQQAVKFILSPRSAMPAQAVKAPFTGQVAP